MRLNKCLSKILFIYFCKILSLGDRFNPVLYSLFILPWIQVGANPLKTFYKFDGHIENVFLFTLKWTNLLKNGEQIY
jgi:hypothetical protein